MKKKWRNTQELLQMIAEMYVFVGQADKEKVPCAHEIAIACDCMMQDTLRPSWTFVQEPRRILAFQWFVHCVQEAISSNTTSPQLWLFEEQKSKHHILMHFACLIATLGQHLNPILMIPLCLSLWFVHNEEIFIRILQCHGWIKSYTLPQSWKSLPTVLDTNPFS